MVNDILLTVFIAWIGFTCAAVLCKPYFKTPPKPEWEIKFPFLRDSFAELPATSSIAWKEDTIKTFYSQRLLHRLNPALSNAKAFDDGYYHSMVFEVKQ